MYFVGSPSPSQSKRRKDEEQPERDNGSVSPDFLRLAYGRARSVTGISLCSTETSSTSWDHFESLDTNEGWLSSSSRSDAQSPCLLEDNEEFFDCLSQASSSDLHHDDDELLSRNDDVALYMNGMCVYADGTPAYVPPGHCDSKVAQNFLEFCGNNEVKARQMWEETQKWRKEREIWKVHTKPNNRFHHAKQHYPSCYHGLDMEERVIEYSFPGQMNPEALLPNETVLDEIMEHHYFMQEYVWNCLYTHAETWTTLGKKSAKIPSPDRASVTNSLTTTRGVVIIIDIEGAGIGLLSADVFCFLKRMIDSSSAHYPELVSRVFLINAPFWVSGVFATIKPLLPDRLPVEIASSKETLNVLRKYIDDDQIPAEYGGSSPYPLHKHPLEKRLHEVVREAALYDDQQTMTESSIIDSVNHDAASKTDYTTSDECSRVSSSAEDDPKSAPPPRCWDLPLLFPRVLRSRNPTFVARAAGYDGHLCLTLREQNFDFFTLTRSLWHSLADGFRGCGL